MKLEYSLYINKIFHHEPSIWRYLIYGNPHLWLGLVRSPGAEPGCLPAADFGCVDWMAGRSVATMGRVQIAVFDAVIYCFPMFSILFWPNQKTTGIFSRGLHSSLKTPCSSAVRWCFQGHGHWCLVLGGRLHVSLWQGRGAECRQRDVYQAFGATTAGWLGGGVERRVWVVKVFKKKSLVDRWMMKTYGKWWWMMVHEYWWKV